MDAFLHRLQRAEAPAQAIGGQGVHGELFLALARCSRAPSCAREHGPGSPAYPPVAARHSDGCRPTLRKCGQGRSRSVIPVARRPREQRAGRWPVTRQSASSARSRIADPRCASLRCASERNTWDPQSPKTLQTITTNTLAHTQAAAMGAPKS